MLLSILKKHLFFVRGGNDEIPHAASRQNADDPAGRPIEWFVMSKPDIVSHMDVRVADHCPPSIIRRCFSSTISWLSFATLQKCSAGLNMSPVSLKLRHMQVEQ